MIDYPIVHAPEMSRDVFKALLKDSPAFSEAGLMYDSLVAEGVSPGVFLGFFWVESKFGQEGIVKEYNTKNPGNVRTPEVSTSGVTVISTPRGNFAKYPTWLSGTHDWALRMLGPKYAGAGLKTVAQVLPKYAPGTDSNDPDKYAQTVIEYVTKFTPKEVPVSTTVPQPRIIQHPSPNRNGYGGTRRVDAIVWHVTAGAFGPSLAWLSNPASGASSNYILDKDGTIYCLVDPREDAWANGAVNKPDLKNPLVSKWLAEKVNFNQRTISIEVAQEKSANNMPGGFTQAQHASLVNLSAYLCDLFNLTPDRTHIIRHAQIDSVNRPYCPGLAEGEMVAWIAEIKKLVDGTPVPPVGPDAISNALRAWYATCPTNLQGNLGNDTFYECTIDFSSLYPDIQGNQRAIRGEYVMAWFMPNGTIAPVFPRDRVKLEDANKITRL